MAGTQTPDWPEHGQRPDGVDAKLWQEYLRRRNARISKEQEPVQQDAGRQPLGRNIWGEAGLVKTPYPVTKPISVSQNAAWVDRNGDTAVITIDGTDYMLDQSNWSMLINTQNEDAINYMEKRLKDAGFFHVSELPPDARQNIQTDFAVRDSRAPVYVPSERRNDVPNLEEGNGEPILLPPHIYHYEPAPDEMYSLEYDNGAQYYLPPYSPNVEPHIGNRTPRDYSGAMPPVGDISSEGYSLDDYLSYAPPVERNAKRPFVYERLEPEQIPLLPEWLFNQSPTANNGNNDLAALGMSRYKNS